MKCLCLLIAAFACILLACAGQEPFSIGDDGSVTVFLQPADGPAQRAVLAFGFPTNTIAKVWREGAVVHRQWVVRGIRYTEAAILQQPDHVTAGARSTAVLLVNIQGENTNADYSEARAELMLTLDGRRQELDLLAGNLWRVGKGRRRLAGGVEIPDPGIKVNTGLVLRFEGNMPPSEKGSMTVKIPLEQVDGEAVAERLRDIDFKEALAKALKAAAQVR